MQTRLAQVVYTLTQFPTVDGVVFSLDGEPIDVLGGEGSSSTTRSRATTTPTSCPRSSSPARR